VPAAMAAPRFVPVPPAEPVRSYESPAHVPDGWRSDRPADLAGAGQPKGKLLGSQGPDQGYALVLANRMRDRLQLQAGEDADDAIAACLAIALRRASLYGRAPVIHDLTIAFTMWGWLDASPPADLVSTRKQVFAEVASHHHYAERRAIADAVSEETLRMTPQKVAALSPTGWRSLTGWTEPSTAH
jgi:hypothetical protein